MVKSVDVRELVYTAAFYALRSDSGRDLNCNVDGAMPQIDMLFSQRMWQIVGLWRSPPHSRRVSIRLLSGSNYMHLIAGTLNVATR